MKTVQAIIAVIQVLLMTGIPALASDTSGTFRGKWWNYYDRGMEYSEAGDFEKAVSDLKKTISMRDNDQRMARTYGMHFIDYFPHRELGIVYFNRGENDRAIAELEESVRSTESAKAVYYLNKARRVRLQQQGSSVRPPSLQIDTPAEYAVVRGLSATIRGKASGQGLISRIFFNDLPYRFEMAGPEIGFSQEVPVADGENTITVRCEDLLGNKAEKTLKVVVDREGPTINIFDIVQEKAPAGDQVRITGEVNDDTGIVSVMINGSRMQTENRKTYEFDVTVAPDSGAVVIQAADRVENETRAELDLKKELAAFGRKPAPVLLAFNGDKIFSSDREAPVIQLKDAAELPTVFVDKYYVEGEAYDNKKVSKILVGGLEVPVKQGKKIFFSKTVSLKEGQNKILVDVLDGSGNKATADFTVTRNIPDVLQNNARLSVSVMPFDTKQKTSAIADLGYDQLIGSLVNQKRFSVVERTKLDQVLTEQKLTKAKLTDPEHSIRVGKLMSAETILATTIREDAKSIEIVSRVINTETSEVMEVKDVFSEDKSLSAVKDLLEGLATKLATAFPVVEGMVIKQDGKEVYSDIGDASKIKKNTGVIVYRKGKEIKHPITGKSLGFDTVKLAEGRFDDVQKDFSKITLLDKSIKGAIAVKDLIITK